MSNKKVYLAKNSLASGFDVEYVKSHLERIPGIIIIEAGKGVKASECASFVIIPNPQFKDSEYAEVTLSKNVAVALEEFIDNYDGEDNVHESIYIYKRNKVKDEGEDVEDDFPMALYPAEDYFIDIIDSESYDAYAVMETCDESDEEELLYRVTDHVAAPYRGWLEVPRHHRPAPEYAMPPNPTVEERLLKTRVSTVSAVIDFGSGHFHGYDKRLLLLRRK